MIILEENFKWHLEAFASELFTSFFRFSLDGRCKRSKRSLFLNKNAVVWTGPKGHKVCLENIPHTPLVSI